ncbi:polyprenyl synthetase family protein [Streptomyces sp. NPDC098789]|uniref:polyprenyl synthetase family protein n=1 Tax=Streptomyces sp. NPDC098789 TaxID=3366098 RepID=UPI0037FF8724
MDLDGVRREVDSLLGGFLAGQARLAEDSRLPDEVVRTLGEFLGAGGKRMRPLLCVTGWHAAGGRGEDAGVLQAAASLEMFHAFALIHDDVMDRSEARRGRPAAHRVMA